MFDRGLTNMRKLTTKRAHFTHFPHPSIDMTAAAVAKRSQQVDRRREDWAENSLEKETKILEIFRKMYS